jgi:serpin B
MKRIFVILSLLVPACLAFSCSKEKSDTIARFTPVNLSADQKQLVVSSNAFGFEFFKKVHEVSGSSSNLMVSPLSVSLALGMARNGASGSTLQAMNNTLGFAGMSDAQVNESYQHIIGTFTSLDPKVKLQIANSTWYRSGFGVEPSFISTNQQYFDSEVTALNFADPAAVNTINGWVSDKTNKLIPTIIDQIPADAVMYLVNAVYFKGLWKYQFETSNTAPKPFTLSDGSVVQAPSMNQHATFPYFKGTGFEAIELLYNQGNFVMSVILPDAGKSIGDIIPLLSQESWNTWSKQFADRDIQLQLPKFKYAYEEKQMKPVLTGMGMGVAFDADQADFTRINSEGGLYISRVLHKSYIATDEAGTEAAAVTAVEIGVTSVGPDQVYHFTVNRPFIYFIQEKSTGTILFIGTVMNPNL